MAKLTPAQQRAVDETSKTLLVSAAAGSGKTTTLIERILRSVVRKEDPVMLDRLLVVTFTKVAASELRLRISAALSDAIAADGENEVLAKQISLLPSAKISTIDSFCLDLVRTNYAALGLSPAFRIADTGESTLLAHETMERLIDECYDNPESKIAGGARGFADLVDLLLGSSDDKRLADLLLSLYETLSAYPRGAAALYDCEATLREYAKADFFASPPGKRIEEHLRDLFAHYRKAYRVCMDRLDADPVAAKAYLPAFSADYDGIRDAEKALAVGYSVGREVISSLSFVRLGSYRGEKRQELEQIKALRDEYKKQVTKLKGSYLAADNATLQLCVSETADVCHALAELLCQYENRAEVEKKRQNICDFSDLSRYTLRLLVNTDGKDTPFAEMQKGLYDAVYIDEYQDVNAVQDRIFSAISTETNRFMVGDIKQSIYAFRGAEPSIFADLRYAYPSIDEAGEGHYATIFMSENFRCGKEIIDFTNSIFDRLMPLISPDMHYTAADALVFRKNASDTKHPVQLILTEKPPKGSIDEGKNAEADYIAKEICRLVREEHKEDGSPITFGDIAILMRSPKAKLDEYAGTLREHGVPVYAETNENLLLQSEVEILRCLLEVIDNPRRDIPLTGVLLSPLCGLDCDFLAAVRNGKKEERLFTTLRGYIANSEENCTEKQKLARFIEQLAEFRRMARFMSAGELVDTV
ncbi:MAG: UvrD-helicase domain-containing protein, partial [Clostridia bacterium]|nr:UvrD-helicase domain-containing protein [Clostridia bacterium]